MSVTDADPREAQAADDMIALGEEAGIGKKDEEVVNCICQLNEENGLMIQVRLFNMAAFLMCFPWCSG